MLLHDEGPDKLNGQTPAPEETNQPGGCACEPGSDRIPETDDPGPQADREKEARERLEQQYMRLLADFENYKRRTRSEMALAGQYAEEEMLTALLPVLDNFQRALESGGQSLDALRSGVELIFRQFIDALRQFGLETIDAVGEPFDPARHEAVARTDDSADPFYVLQEFRRGYSFRGKVLRASMVQVGPGGGETTLEPEQAVEGEGNE